jgi:hypothetical protein
MLPSRKAENNQNICENHCSWQWNKKKFQILLLLCHLAATRQSLSPQSGPQKLINIC